MHAGLRKKRRQQQTVVFGGRRLRGSWYRLTLEEVRHALATPALLEAPARARAAAAAAAREPPAAPRSGKQLRTQTEKQRAYQRRRRQERTRKQKRAAKLLEEMTQQQAAAALGVTPRTLRNWKTGAAATRIINTPVRRGRPTATPPATGAAAAPKAEARNESVAGALSMRSRSAPGAIDLLRDPNVGACRSCRPLRAVLFVMGGAPPGRGSQMCSVSPFGGFDRSWVRLP